MKSSNSLKDLFDDPYSHEPLIKTETESVNSITNGTGACLYVGCDCKGFVDDGGGLYKCKTCGHRKLDHS